MENNALVPVGHTHPAPQPLTAFASEPAFEAAQRMAKALCSSNLVPASYQGQQNIGSALIALEIAQRLQASPLMVMQNLNVIHGRPAWSSQFIIAALNSCGRFSPLRFDVSGDGDNRTCTAWATDKSGERLEGPPASIAMAKKEGWFGKNGSKWQSMPELMLRYRAAAFFGRLYAPDILMGMPSADEAVEIAQPVPTAATATVNDILEPLPEPEQEPKPERKRRVKAEVIETTPITPDEEPQPEPAGQEQPTEEPSRDAKPNDDGDIFS